jgi:hypothetical protein
MVAAFDYNIFSPIDDEEGDVAGYWDNDNFFDFESILTNFINDNSKNGVLDPNKFNLNNVSVDVFKYKPRGISQQYTIRIRNMDDALIVAALILDRPKLANLNMHGQLLKTYNLFNAADLTSVNHILKFVYENFNQWYSIERRTHPRTRGAQLINPITGRFIYNYNIEGDRRKYRSIFGNIKLRKVIYDELQNYHTVKYDTIDYCVINFLEKKLLKNEFNIIKDELNVIKTPTYPELTLMLNKIDYNLNVFIIDGEQLQQQIEYTKSLNIMIHNDHMYVLKFGGGSSFEINHKKIIEIENHEFDELKITPEIYYNDSKMINGIKYKIKNYLKKIDPSFSEFKTSFSHNNIDFFNECNIRPVRYINNSENVKLIQALDINSCYQNIMYNENYVFAIHNGLEETTQFNKNDVIERWGFYFIEWNDKDEIFNILFGKSNKLWIYGDIILTLKIQKKIKIYYKHMPYTCTSYTNWKDVEYTKEEKKNNKIMDTLYTGILAQTIKHKTTHYKCDNDEAKALYQKYKELNEVVSFEDSNIFTTYKGDDNKKKQKTQQYKTYEEKQKILDESSKLKNSKNEITESNITLHNDYFVQTAGLYVYLSIVSYARLQLYYIYSEIKNLYPDIIVKKVYTDSITFNHKLSNDMPKFVSNINEKLKKFQISVKPEISNYIWSHREIQTQEPIIKEKQEIKYNTNVKELLDYEQSFVIDSCAGYGKSHTIKNFIIPYFERNNLSYKISSTTVADAKNNGSQTINSLISCNDASLNNILNEFKNTDYLIIDECSRLNSHLLNILQYIRRNNDNIKFIFVGDSNQCQYNSLNMNIMKTNIFLELCEYNIFKIQWHNEARYSKDYDTFLNKLLSFTNSVERLKYVKLYFKNQIKKIGQKDDNKIKICYTNNMAKSIGGNTTHKMQGFTINESLSIYEIDRMPKEVIYTSLSRITDPKLITIFI